MGIEIVIIILLILILVMLILQWRLALRSDFDFDSSGRLRVSEPLVMATLTHTRGKNTENIDEVITGTGTSVWNSNESVVDMSVDGKGSVKRQSIRYNIYQAGKTLTTDLTFNFDPNGNNHKNVICRAGLFDDDNGYYFEYTNRSMRVVKRTKVTGTVENTVVSRKRWNGNFRPKEDKAQLGYIQILWLGVGPVIFGFIDETGKRIPVYKFDHINDLKSTHTTNANLPVRYEIINDADEGSGTMKHICSSVMSDGGYRPDGISFSISNTEGTTTAAGSDNVNGLLPAVGTAERIALIIRPGDDGTKFYNTIIDSVKINPSAAAAFHYNIYLFKATESPISGGTTWATVHNNCAIEYQRNITTQANFSTTNGVNIEQGSVTILESTSSKFQLWDSNTILSTGVSDRRDYLMVTVQMYGAAASGNFDCSINFREVF